MQPTLSAARLIPIEKIVSNDGQIPGLPRNPRLIRDEKFDALKSSILENPEMLGFRELLVYPFDDTFIAIGGNMRLAAMRDLGYKEAPCKVLSPDTTPRQLRAYTMKDNYGYGEWDMSILQGEWDMSELEEWSMDDIVTFDLDDVETEPDAPDAERYDVNPYAQVTDSPIYQITGICPDVSELVDTKKVDELYERIDASTIPDDIKSMLRVCAWRHARINFGLMAEYYAHAEPEVQELMEDNALVIIDFNRAVENGFAVLRKDLLDIYNKNNAAHDTE